MSASLKNQIDQWTKSWRNSSSDVEHLPVYRFITGDGRSHKRKQLPSVLVLFILHVHEQVINQMFWKQLDWLGTCHKLHDCSVLNQLHLKFELGSTDIHASAQALSHHHAHTPDLHHIAVEVALHATQQTLQQLWEKRHTQTRGELSEATISVGLYDCSAATKCKTFPLMFGDEW